MPHTFNSQREAREFCAASVACDRNNRGQTLHSRLQAMSEAGDRNNFPEGVGIGEQSVLVAAGDVYQFDKFVRTVEVEGKEYEIHMFETVPQDHHSHIRNPYWGKGFRVCKKGGGDELIRFMYRSASALPRVTWSVSMTDEKTDALMRELFETFDLVYYEGIDVDASVEKLRVVIPEMVTRLEGTTAA